MVLGFSLPVRTSVTEFMNHPDYIEFRQALCPLVLYKSMVALTTPFNQKNMQFKLQKANERGTADHGWLKAKHSFSFASYYHPEKMNFGALSVLNDDIIAGGMGFGMHPHDNMEIITIPLEGALEHKDSIGNIGHIEAGDVQVMSAGTGIRHSEYNKNKDKFLKLFQIWIMPNVRNVPPRYDQISLNLEERHNKLQQIISPNKNEDGIWIHQNAWIHIAKFDSNLQTQYTLKSKDNGIYLLNISGEIGVLDQLLESRDAIAITNKEEIEIKAITDAEFLIIEVPMI